MVELLEDGTGARCCRCWLLSTVGAGWAHSYTLDVRNATHLRTTCTAGNVLIVPLIISLVHAQRVASKEVGAPPSIEALNEDAGRHIVRDGGRTLQRASPRITGFPSEVISMTPANASSMRESAGSVGWGGVHDANPSAEAVTLMLILASLMREAACGVSMCSNGF